MITFLRKIRKKLMNENKIGSYTIYAIGEIALVVIGILLALQIDTWNENRKIDESSKLHLKTLKQNILDERSQLEKLIVLVNGNLIATDSLRLQFQKIAKPNIMSIKYLSLLNIEYELKPIRSGIETILKSDELTYLDLDIQNAIHHYYQIIKNVQERELKMNTFIKDKYEPYVFQNYPIIFQKSNPWSTIVDFYKNDQRKQIPFDYNKIFNDKLLEGQLFARNYLSLKVKENYSDLVIASDELLTLLKEY